MARFVSLAIGVVATTFLSGSASARADGTGNGVEQSVAVVRPAAGHHIRGVVRFVELERGEWEKELEASLAPGETRLLQATLEKGTYEVYCPVKDHRGEGMERELSVKTDSAR